MMPQYKQPKGLTYLSLTEMWERFSYYGISGILVLYLTKVLNLTISEASIVSGTYMAFSHLSPMLGGLIADRLIGYIWSVILGGIIILIGNILLALPYGLHVIYLGLATVAMGTGFLKSTVSVLVGQLYAKDDVRRDSAYTIFYIGINFGSILAGLIISYVAEVINWRYAFILMAIGMMFGLITFIIGYKKGFYTKELNIISHVKPEHYNRFFNSENWLILAAIFSIPFLFLLLTFPEHTKIIISIITIGMLSYIISLSIRSDNKKERNQLLSIVIFIITGISFWALYKQLFNSVAFFMDKDVDRSFLGITIPTGMFVLVPNSFFIILMALGFSKIWTWLETKGKNPSSPTKLLLGLLFTLAGFLMLSFSAYLAQSTGHESSMLWPIVGIFFLTCAELCISPVGLSLVNKMAPTRYAAFLMGAWFITISIGSYISGILSSCTGLPKGAIPIKISAEAYYNLFLKCSVGMAVMVIIYVLLLPLIKRLAREE
jgi:POT family proton-dependent oligopeptide transporter